MKVGSQQIVTSGYGASKDVELVHTVVIAPTERNKNKEADGSNLAKEYYLSVLVHGTIRP